jgi:hypothetical protein
MRGGGVGDIGEELQHLALEAVEAALAAFTGDEPYPFVFFVDGEGQAHTIVIAPKEGSDGSDLVEVARHTVAEELGQVAQLYALAYDGYLTTDGERSDAAFVEAGERGQPAAFLIAQRYRVKKRSKKVESVGPPTIIDAAEQLLG